jgi:primase-polymerase (primpol)-like protein
MKPKGRVEAASRERSRVQARPAKTVALHRDTIPVELRNFDQWVGYLNLIRNGRRTKVPCRTDGSGRAAVDDSATWSPFAAALAAYERRAVDGIGFVFTAADPFTGIDLDECLDAGRLHPSAAAIVERLSSYTEGSPGGCGLHVLVLAELAGKRHRTRATEWGGHFEAYDHSRFFTITGLHVPGTPRAINARQDEVDVLITELVPPRETRPLRASPPLTRVDLSDEQLLERARRAKNGPLFSRLFDRGDWTGYESQSEADLALCGILAFWSRGSANLIDRLFRMSSLVRAKWDEPGHDSSRPDLTYGDLTVELAIDGCPTFYTPREERLRAIVTAVTPEEAEAIARRDFA